MATLDEKLLNPARHYAAPADVIGDPELTYAQKCDVLKAWRQDAERLAESTAEGMGGGEPAHLRAVALAQQQLDALTFD